MVDRYCDEACQSAHWKTHKRVCKERRRARKAPTLPRGASVASAYERGNALVTRYERLWERGSAAEAKAALSEALALGHPRAIHMKARCLVDEGDVGGGIELFEQMIGAGMGEHEGGCDAGMLEYNAGRAHMTRWRPGDCERALELFDVALGKNSENAGAAVMKGVVLGMTGRRAEARAVLEMVIERFGDRVEEASTAHYNMAHVCMIDGDSAAATEHLRAYLRVQPGPEREARMKLFFCENPRISFALAAAVALGLLRTVYCLLPRLSKWLAAAICARYVVRIVSPYIKTK